MLDTVLLHHEALEPARAAPTSDRAGLRCLHVRRHQVGTALRRRGIAYAEIRADLKKRGTLIGANDLFIAAHARSLGLALVTNNTAEFGRVKGLVIENWVGRVR